MYAECSVHRSISSSEPPSEVGTVSFPSYGKGHGQTEVEDLLEGTQEDLAEPGFTPREAGSSKFSCRRREGDLQGTAKDGGCGGERRRDTGRGDGPLIKPSSKPTQLPRSQAEGQLRSRGELRKGTPGGSRLGPATRRALALNPVSSASTGRFPWEEKVGQCQRHHAGSEDPRPLPG